jgi:antitoxin HicB
MPGAGTSRTRSRRAVDALITLFAQLISKGAPIPRPLRPKRRQPLAVLLPQVSAKLAIYEAKLEAGLTPAGLEERLAYDPRQVRSLLHLDRRSRLDQLEAALTALGKDLVLKVRDTPRAAYDRGRDPVKA